MSHCFTNIAVQHAFSYLKKKKKIGYIIDFGESIPFGCFNT